MRSFTLAASVAVTGLSAFAAGQTTATALATIDPCPACPSAIQPANITVTSQYQAVSTCSPVVTSQSSTIYTIAECSTYDFVSTVIPDLGGASTTLITTTDQIVDLAHVSTVLTDYTYAPCPTAGPFVNGSTAAANVSCTSTTESFTTLVLDIHAPYNELGALALPPYPGSGLCTVCGDGVQELDQPVSVTKCLNGACTTYAETWVSKAPAPSTSTATSTYSSTTNIPNSGLATVPVTATFTPDGEGYTAAVTSTFSITTSVPTPGEIDITAVITIIFTAPAPTAAYSTTTAPVSTSTYASNGVHTIPVVTTVYPTGPGFSQPVPTTVYHTTSVTDGPKTVYITIDVTVTFTSTVTVYTATVIDGVTQPTVLPTVPALTTGGAAGGTTATPTATPSAAPGVVNNFEYLGCLGSSAGFPTFNLESSSAANSVDLCTAECGAAGYTYAGLYSTDCYCANSVDDAATDQVSGVCDTPCPGDASESCGGTVYGSTRKRAAPANILLDCYENTLPTASSTIASSTSEPTADPSSDPDPAPAKRGIDADMEVRARQARNIKLRRGGLLRNPKKEQGPVVAKRDFALKKPFGQ